MARQLTEHATISTPRSSLLCVPGGPVALERGSTSFIEAATKVFGKVKALSPDSVQSNPTREEKMKTVQEVLSFAPSSAKPGAWLKVKLIDDKGTARESFIKSAALAAMITQPGRYEFEKQKEGAYWEITGVKFLGGTTAAPSTGGGSAGPSPARHSGAADVNVIIQNKSIISQVAIKAAAEVVGNAMANGAFKTEDGTFAFSDAADAALTLAASFMKEAGDFVRSQPVAKPAAKAYVDEAGRTHEPVEGA